MLNLHKVFTSSVGIASIEVLKFQGNLFVRSTSKDEAAGIVMANGRLRHCLSLLKGLIMPYFQGKDARDLESLVEGVYIHNSNYKNSGVPFWNCVAHVEMSLLDMLGNMAGKPVGALLGDVIRTEIPIYISSFAREKTAEETVKGLHEMLAQTGTKAFKLKIGGRMSKNADSLPGRTEALIPLARKSLGDKIELYVDANGSYDSAKAVEIGRMLEAHNYGFFEEPCPWEDFVETKRVADALDITVAGGEQDTSMPKFEWMIHNRGVDLIQPDLMYNGGFIRCMQVARMAASAGMQITPHSPTIGPTAAPKIQFASVVPNFGPYQEHRAASKSETWYSPSFEAKNGAIEVPTGPGLGVSYDQEVWSKAEKLL
jgi:L-alanine-DL-glutamate epimerase-like enolase superfamily enzyme